MMFRGFAQSKDIVLCNDVHLQCLQCHRGDISLYFSFIVFYYPPGNLWLAVLDVRFVVTSSCLQEGSCLIVLFLCLSIVMSNMLSYYRSLRFELRVIMSYTFSLTKDVRFVFPPDLKEGLSLIHVVCVVAQCGVKHA